MIWILVTKNFQDAKYEDICCYGLVQNVKPNAKHAKNSQKNPELRSTMSRRQNKGN